MGMLHYNKIKEFLGKKAKRSPGHLYVQHEARCSDYTTIGVLQRTKVLGYNSEG